MSFLMSQSRSGFRPQQTAPPIAFFVVFGILGLGRTAMAQEQNSSQAQAPENTVTPADDTDKDPLPKELLSQDAEKRARAIQEVVRNNQSKALFKLELMAKTDAVPGVRRYACWAIGKLELKEGIPTLLFVIENDTSAVVRKAAKRSLARLQAEDESQPETVASTTPPGKLVPCRKDNDCKGVRVCTNKVCREPRKLLPTVGWALEASVIGFIGSAAVAGLTIYSSLNIEKLLPAIPLAASATLITIIVAPSAKSGSKSARDSCNVPGSLTARVIGWVAFGIHVGGTLALAGTIPLHWLYVDEGGNAWIPDMSWVLASGLLGTVSLVFLSIDALVARKQAEVVVEEYAKKHPAPKKEKKPDVSLAPTIAPFRSPDGDVGVMAGFAGIF